MRDIMLTEVSMSVVVMTTDIVADSRRQTSEMNAIPLDYLKGFFCKITPGMVKRLLLHTLEI